MMVYLEVFSSKDHKVFYEAEALLREKGFDYHILFEYRFDGGIFCRPTKPVLLRVRDKEAAEAHRILKRAGFIIDEAESNQGLMEDFVLQGQSRWCDRAADPQKLIGKSLDRVFYFFANSQGLTKGPIHYVDAGVVLSFEGQIYLSVAFQENGEYMEGLGRHLPPLFHLTVEEGKMNTFELFKKRELSHLGLWSSLINTKLVGVKPFVREWKDDFSVFTDLLLEFENGSVAICATKEPHLDRKSRLDLRSLRAVSNESLACIFEMDVFRKHRGNLA